MFAGWCNGNTWAFGAYVLGSSPSPAALRLDPTGRRASLSASFELCRRAEEKCPERTTSVARSESKDSYRVII